MIDLGLPLVMLTAEMMPVLAKIVSQNLELRRLGVLLLKDASLLSAFAAVLQNARTPLCIHCIASQDSIDILAKLAGTNPLLEFKFNGVY